MEDKKAYSICWDFTATLRTVIFADDEESATKATKKIAFTDFTTGINETFGGIALDLSHYSQDGVDYGDASIDNIKLEIQPWKIRLMEPTK